MALRANGHDLTALRAFTAEYPNGFDIGEGYVWDGSQFQKVFGDNPDYLYYPLYNRGGGLVGGCDVNGGSPIVVDSVQNYGYGICYHDGFFYVAVYNVPNVGIIKVNATTGEQTVLYAVQGKYNNIKYYSGFLYVTLANGDYGIIRVNILTGAMGVVVSAPGYYRGIAKIGAYFYVSIQHSIIKRFAPGTYVTLSSITTTSRNWYGICEHNGFLYGGTYLEGIVKVNVTTKKEVGHYLNDGVFIWTSVASKNGKLYAGTAYQSGGDYLYLIDEDANSKTRLMNSPSQYRFDLLGDLE